MSKKLELLYDAVKSGKTYTHEDLQDNELALQVQTRLNHFELIANNPSGGWGNISKAALARFNKLAINSDNPNLDKQSLKALIETDFTTWQFGYKCDRMSLATQLFLYFKLNDWDIDTKPGALNLCSLRGFNRNNSLNSDTKFQFNDRLIAFTFKSQSTDQLLKPSIVGNWLATSEPGRFYWDNPMNPDGCAVQIEGVQFKAWGTGIHRDYRALTQQAAILVVRGKNQVKDKGYFGINIHSVGKNQDYSLSEEIGKYSAGCTVLASRDEFDREFMPMIYQDTNYKANNKYLWNYVAIAGTKFRQAFPIF